MRPYGIPRNLNTDYPDVADGKFYGFNGIGWSRGAKRRARRPWKKLARLNAKRAIQRGEYHE